MKCGYVGIVLLLPLLMNGVCLGHQAIGEAYGGVVTRARRVMHGKLSHIVHDGTGLFAGVPSPMGVMRYHSLVIKELQHTGLDVIAQCEDGTVMAIAHKHYNCVGVQFHPESVGTEYGLQILNNWAEM
jgi:anthranilate synthase/aminodeoxychorismate synthase-like glutamine amidotransferase